MHTVLQQLSNNGIHTIKLQCKDIKNLHSHFRRKMTPKCLCAAETVTVSLLQRKYSNARKTYVRTQIRTSTKFCTQHRNDLEQSGVRESGLHCTNIRLHRNTLRTGIFFLYIYHKSLIQNKVTFF
jgi:hypothetical protein